MHLTFVKMNGAGNDFICLDNREGKLTLRRNHVVALCDRHRGVGADGVLVVEASKTKGADFRMRYYNADGGEAEMCGNGARCFARFAQWITQWKKEEMVLQTKAGLVHAWFLGERVRIELTPPVDWVPSRWIKLKKGRARVASVNTGVPHAVEFVEDLAAVDVVQRGREIRHHEAFAPKGTNVNFVHKAGRNRIEVRTYERGVEDETLACGTGVAASALCAHLEHEVETPVRVKVKGGDILEVDFRCEQTGDVHKLSLLGPADFVFTGEIDV